MKSVGLTKQAVKRLDDAGFLAFRSWFSSYDGEAWERQFEVAAAAGRRDALAVEALSELRASNCTGRIIGNATRPVSVMPVSVRPVSVRPVRPTWSNHDAELGSGTGRNDHFSHWRRGIGAADRLNSGRWGHSGRLNGEDDAVADTAVLQLDDRSRAQIEVSAARVHRRDDHVVADAVLGHQDEISILHRAFVGLVRRMLVVGLGDSGIPLLASVFGIANETTSNGARGSPDEGTASRMSGVVTDRGTGQGTKAGPHHSSASCVVASGATAQDNKQTAIDQCE